VAIIWLEPSGVETKRILGIIDETRLDDEADFGKLRYCGMDDPLSLNFLKLPYRKTVILDTLINIINQWVAYATGQVKLTTGMRDVLRDFLYPELDKKHPKLTSLLHELRQALKAIKKKDPTQEEKQSAQRLYKYSKEDLDSANRLAHRLSDILEDEAFNKIICGETFDWENFLELGEFLALNCRGMTKDQSLFVGNVVVQALTTYFTHTDKEEFPPCAIYIDEFERFINSAFVEVMRYAAKFNIGCLVSHQDHAMWGKSLGKEVLHTIWSNVGTILAFRVGAAEAATLSKMFTKFKPHTFQNLPEYHVAARIGVEENILKAPRPPIPDEIEFVSKPRKFRLQWGWYETH
jgi:hypothetical protein